MADPTNRNDEQRFADWVREHGSAVYGFLRAMLRRPEEARELTQDVFCRAWQARDKYREQGNARAYLMRIADRLACDRHRRPLRSVNLDDDGWRQHEPSDEAAEPLRTAVLTEETEMLSAALDRLSEMQRRVLLLRYYGQFDFAEIATITACPLSTTLSHCRRGLEALRRLLGGEKP